MFWSALQSLTLTEGLLTLGALGLALGFEFVNGFHDTANAVATVLYTRSLRPTPAVVWSGICNMIGILVGGIGVAYSIIHLLPVDLLMRAQGHTNLAMILSLLLSALFWNVGTWYFGIPASSSHALIGAILGIGAANAFLAGHSPLSGINLHKVQEIGLSLLLSPLFGFLLAGFLQWLLLKVAPFRQLHVPPRDSGQAPPWWIRTILIGTCSGVSFAHGSNDGQKGMGLVMLILMGMAPAHFALNFQSSLSLDELQGSALFLSSLVEPDGEHSHTDAILRTVGTHRRLQDLSPSARWELRGEILHLDAATDKLIAADPKADWTAVKRARANLRRAVEYVPNWVVIAIALSLGLGTMVGWQRIVITVGEKIGKSHLTYSQGASAELVAMGTIGLASFSGLPVSTTHVLSSGVAGTMSAARAGVNLSTLRTLILAWLLTLPTTMGMAALFFFLLR